MQQKNDRVNEATSKFSEATRRSYRALMDGAFAAQKQYVKLALNGVDDPAETFRNQAEITRRTVEVVAEQSKKQWEAL